MQSLPRPSLAYFVPFIFILWFLVHTQSLSGMTQGFPPFHRLNSPIPDFSHYNLLRTIPAKDFPIDDPTRRVIITGDLHGMMKPLENLLYDLNYSSTKDVFIHVGDIITKGPHKDSMSLLTYLASNNITGVRGNNDQKVVEWRGWLNWITSLPGGKCWLDRLEKNLPNDIASDKSKLIQWMSYQRNGASKDDQKWWKLIPSGWLLFGDHYKVAKDISDTGFQYLLDLPLRLYIPSAHVFIVHAGLLPSDPKYPYYDETQPLARMPKLEGVDTKHETSKVEGLRNLQEISLLKLIPQNMVPWVLLNMRSVWKGQVSKKIKGKTPWSDLWEQEMNSCVGYSPKLDGESKKDPKHPLPCYPSTVIYGHAAARGLDPKRWSVGLDSGCVYGRELSALVIGGTEDKPYDHFESSAVKHGASFLFSDHAIARIRTVKCQNEFNYVSDDMVEFEVV